MIEARSVSSLVQYLKELLESDLTLTNLWVEGEISNLSRPSSGHAYFTLKDRESQVRCVMFRRRGGGAGAPIANGELVLAHGNISFYEQRGDIQLVVDFVQPAGVGARQAEFERLKERLEADGLFDVSRKRPLPVFPARIGVITSPTGAVWHDICNVLARRWPLAELVLAPTAVQGNDAAIGVADAIRALNIAGGLDVIIVARGGGSMEELWPFNEEIVARAIYASAIPIVSAIGHETDFTIADFVADFRAPTPSAAAESVAPDWRDISRQVQAMSLLLFGNVNVRVSDGLMNIERADHRLRSALPDVSRQQERVGTLLRHAATAAARALEQRTASVESCELRLGSLDPRRTLARGYAVVQLREGKQAITSTAQVKGKDRLDVYVKDGKFPAEVSRQYGF